MPEPIDLDLLPAVVGGIAPRRPPPTAPAAVMPEWVRVARDYAAACVGGAGNALIYGGKPTSVNDALGKLAVGCVTGVGIKAVADATSLIDSK